MRPRYPSKCSRLSSAQEILLILLLLLAFPGLLLAEQGGDRDPASGLTPITLQLKWKHQFQFAGYYAALEKGFYRDAGFDVQIREHQGQHSPIQTLLRGEADFAVSGADVVIHRAMGDPVVALATIYQHSPYGFLVLSDSGIGSIRDLKGKRVMMGRGVQDAALQAALRRAGLHAGDFELVETTFDPMSLVRGEVVAFNAYVTDQEFTLRAAGYESRNLLPKQLGVDFYGDILVTSEKKIETEPEQVKRFREASLKGWRYALTHPEEIISYILDRYNSQGMSRAHLRFEAQRSRELIQPLLVEIGYMNPERWQHILEVFTELNFVGPGSSIKGLVYQSGQPQPSWVEWLVRNWVAVSIGVLLLFAILLVLMVLQARVLVRRRNSQLIESERKYRTVFNAAPEGMWLIDCNRLTLDVNDRLSQLLGYSAEEMRGRTPLDFVDEENRKIFIEQTGKIETTDQRHYEIALRHRNGYNIPTRINAVTLRDGDGSVLAALAFVEDISERTTMELNLRRSEKNLRTLIDAEPACVKTLDRDGRLLSMNTAGLHMIEADSMEQVRFAEVADLVDESYKEKFRELNQRIFEGGEETLRFSITGLKGKKRWLETHAVPLRDENGEVSVHLGLTRDVTEQVQMEQQIREEKDFLQRVIDSISDSVMVISPDYEVQLANKAARTNMYAGGWKHAEQEKCYQVSAEAGIPCRESGQPCPVSTVLATGKMDRATHIHQTVDGTMRRLELVASPLWNSDGSLRAVIEVARDITEHLELLDKVREQKDHLQHIAHHDPLTNLPNRVLFQDRLEQAIHKAHRSRSLAVVLFVDLDRFKEINDSLGHGYGDRVLQEVAVRFSNCVREDDTIARLGGDEFTFIMESVEKPQFAALMAQKLIASLKDPFVIDDHQLFLTASIGISIYPQDGKTAPTLLRNADAAMYKAKEEGKNTFQYYTEDMTAQAFERIYLETSLRRAIDQDELVVYYQAQVNARTSEVVGVEALVRWQHPDMGVVSPARFIPLAEDTGLIVPIGYKVLRDACRQMSDWKQRGISPGKLAVNLSLKQLGDSRLVEILQQTLKEAGLDPRQLELETTEGFLMKDPEYSVTVLKEIRKLGIGLAIDDFGKGYSSLTYLKRFPLTRLKIDRSFVRDLPDDPEDVAITRAVLALSRSLGLKVIAEGVEKVEQRNFLIAEGCSEIQGYLYSKPVPAEEMTAWLQQGLSLLEDLQAG
jgi:diguanylate cyclase (GGDEF)-like protein/PAS domain S-box-containing protein